MGSSGDFVQQLNDGLADGNLMWDFTQHQTYEKGSATREGFAEWVTIAGGFMSFVIRVSQLILGRYQKFTIEKSMIKRLYSKRLERNKNTNYSNGDDDDLTPEQREIKESILNRVQISTGYW